MAEAAGALAAFGLAANILQFLDLAARIGSRSWKAYRDPGHQSEDGFDHLTLQELTTELQSSLQQLESQQSPPYRTGGSPDGEVALSRVAQDCAKVAAMLLKRLNELSALRNSGKKRDALKAAMGSIWGQEEIRLLEQRLEQFRTQLSLQLLVSVRQSRPREEKLVALDCFHDSGAVQESEAMVEALRKTIANPLDSAPGPVILRYVCSRVPRSEEREAVRIVQQGLLEAITIDGHNVTPSLPLDKSGTPGNSRQQSIEDQLLSHLNNSTVDERFLQVQEAHKSTFRWIFLPASTGDDDSSPWSDFSEWLQDADAPLYWITGKPGSGKSTLMKFIITHPSAASPSNDSTMVSERLRIWSGSAPLTVASFFASYSGDKLQRTFQGLCHSLLFQLVSRHKYLLPILFPSCWESMWLLDELSARHIRSLAHFGDQATLLKALHEVVKTSKVFFHVDGLDEVEGTEEVANLLLELASVPNVKICVSSRPWPVFQEAFGQKPHLTMQQLTRPDIEAYVTTKFDESPGFLRLHSREPEYAAQLISQVAEKSSGVFLWVTLVVRSLLKGLREDGRLVDLERRLSALPDDLNKLFSRILGNLDPFHFSHALQYFGIVSLFRRKIGCNLEALLLSLTDEECPKYVMQQEIRPFSDLEVEERIQTLERRISSVTGGFLEITLPHYPRLARVDYLHRTVAEYLGGDCARETLSRDGTPAPDEATLSTLLASAYVSMIKGLNTRYQGTFVARGSDFSSFVNWALFFARGADMALATENHPLAKSVVDILDELHKSGTNFAKTEAEAGVRVSDPRVKAIQSTLESGHWTLSETHSLEPVTINMQFREVDGFGRTFQSLVSRNDICCYIRARAPPRCLVQRLDFRNGRPVHTIWPLLSDALGKRTPDHRMLHQLLRLDADPVFEFSLEADGPKTTPLDMALLGWEREDRKAERKAMQQLILHMLSITGPRDFPKRTKVRLDVFQRHLRSMP